MSRSLCSSADCVIFNQRVLDAGQGGALADLARNAPNAQFTELRGISELYVMAFLPCHERAGLVKCGSCCGCLGGSWSVLGAFWGLLGKKPPRDITQDASDEPNLGLWRRRYGELTGGVQRDALRRGTRRRGTRPWWRRSRHHIYTRGLSSGPGLGKSKSFLSHS